MANSSVDLDGVERRFPQELLDATDHERLKYFSRKDLIVSHPILRRVLRELLEAVDPGLDQNMVLLVGSSGVGKTSLTKLVCSNVNRTAMAIEPNDRTKIPAIWVEADAPERGSFDWKPFYIDILKELQIPLIGATLPVMERTLDERTRLQTIAPERSSRIPAASSLRDRVSASIKSRKVQAIVIDEAANLLTSKSYRNGRERKERIMTNASSVRSLVNKSYATLILAGAFDLFDMVNLSGQLARRGQIVFFPEYDSTETGLQGFAEGVFGLLSHLPGHWEADTRELTSLLFEQGLGSIGMARTILHRWLKKSLDRKITMNTSLLKQCFFPKAALRTLREERQFGRSRFEELSSTEISVEKPAAIVATSEHTVGKLGQAGESRVGQTAPNRRWNEAPPVA